ncbi:hypothetical protein HGRIS_013006 [Hohenbuehelia grisea]|uniref:Non-haem dioxygenase N-terminal domain-containing protein n=1 Tax=Hohenbuehelia grisea TaxID=104357 RepID=A0ABR3IU83_9AGAR
MDMHPKFPAEPSPGFLLANQRTESTFEQIPVIDLQNARSTDFAARRALADLIRDACINVGFFYVKNHGIPETLISDAIEAGKRYFALPTDAKMQHDIHKSDNFKGYTPLLGENTNPEGKGDLHEGFDIGWEPFFAKIVPGKDERQDGAMTGHNVWPQDLPGFREAVLSYYHAAVHLGQLLFPLFALALDLPENYFDDKAGRCTPHACLEQLLTCGCEDN